MRGVFVDANESLAVIFEGLQKDGDPDVRINRDPWTAADNNRGIEGAGLGMRWLQGPWSADLAVGWHPGDEPSVSEAGADRMRGWLSVGYRF